MRKLFIIVTALAMGACSQFEEHDLAPKQTVDAPATIEASFEEPSSTVRTFVDDDNLLRWSANDQISYFPGVNYNMQYRFKGETGDNKGSFEKMNLEPVTGTALDCNYAVYPYAESTTIAIDGTISYTLPEVQSYAENSFGLGANPMVAATEDTDDTVLRFKNACGYLELKLYGNDATVKSITFKGNNNEKLAGAATLTATYNQVPTLSMSETASTSVTLDCSADGGVLLSSDSSKPTTFWFVLPETTFSKGFTVTVTGVDGGTFTKSTSKSVTIERNMIQPMAAFKATLAGEGIDVVNNKVRFYLEEKSGATRTATTLAKRNWSTSTVKVNGTSYEIQSPSQNPYVEVAIADNGIYTAVLETSTSSSRYGSNAYTDVKLPYSQFQNTVEGIITSFPMYAAYSKENGNKLVFNDGFALVNLKLKGTAKIASVRIENPAETVIAGISNADATTGKFTISKGMDFAALNCTNQGNFVTLNNASATDFYVMLAPGNYSSGLKVTICDAEHGAMFIILTSLTLEAGNVHTINLNYACEKNLVFYEGFDLFVWGGDIVKGETGFGFAPTAETVTIDSGKELTGYEDAFEEVDYSNPGTGFIQSNTWNDVLNQTVSKSHQMSESYVKSRNIGDYRYMFRCQERPGYVVIGDGNAGRGISHTTVSKKMVGIGDIKVNIRFAVEANYSGTLLINVCEGGVIKSAKMNGVALDATEITQKYSGATASINIPQKYFSVPKSAAAAKEWNNLEMVISGATDGTCYYIADNNTAAGQHGIYVDSIEARKISDWEDVKNLRVLYWNIQNGMIADQHNNYDNFVKWVKDWDPDICIWCESESIYKDKSGTWQASKFLPDGWSQVSSRYGHSDVAVGGNRDNYPQTITSKYPIETIKTITDTNDGGKFGVKYVSHGAGHFQIDVHGKKINFVTLHLWPQAYAPEITDKSQQDISRANNEGHYFREYEMNYIVKNTINHASNAGEEYWVLCGDTNSYSRLDDWSGKYSTNNPLSLLAHDIVLNNTNLKDAIASRDCYGERNNVTFRSRIDVMYLSPKMFDMITNSIMLMDDWTGPQPAWTYHTAFRDPSDHTPILVDFNIK